jgi:hypothetical protein
VSSTFRVVFLVLAMFAYSIAVPCFGQEEFGICGGLTSNANANKLAALGVKWVRMLTDHAKT